MVVLGVNVVKVETRLRVVELKSILPKPGSSSSSATYTVPAGLALAVH